MSPPQDASAGPVFQPAKDDYAQTYELGSKASKTRKQYDTGGPASQPASPPLHSRCMTAVAAPYLVAPPVAV